jgi:predicted oxidoreductase (fatty acid repression mutant protein)
MEYQKVHNVRRSQYALKKAAPVSDEILIQRLGEALQAAPSAFNGESPRIVIALGKNHEKIWEITKATLKKIVPAEKFASTNAKLTMFEKGYGTILVYDDNAVERSLKEQYPTYAARQDEWGEHNVGIAILALWETLVDLGFGANLQHYNPLIDDEVNAFFKVPASWVLKGELVFGAVVSPAEKKESLPLAERVLVAKD